MLNFEVKIGGRLIIEVDPMYSIQSDTKIVDTVAGTLE